MAISCPMHPNLGELHRKVDRVTDETQNDCPYCDEVTGQKTL